MEILIFKSCVNGVSCVSRNKKVLKWIRQWSREIPIKQFFLCRQFRFISSSLSSRKEKSNPPTCSSHSSICLTNIDIHLLFFCCSLFLCWWNNWHLLTWSVNKIGKNTSLEQNCVKLFHIVICGCISVDVYILFRGFFFLFCFYQNVHMTCNIIYKQCSHNILHIFSNENFEHLKDTLKYKDMFYGRLTHDLMCNFQMFVLK